MNSRVVMARVLTSILKHGNTLDEALQRELANNPTSRDNKLIQEVCYGVIRHYQALDHVAAQLLDKPLKRKDLDIKALILCGLYQLHYLNTADHAAIAETVAATTKLKKNWAKSLVNAVLRRSQRQAHDSDLIINNNESTQYLHPAWIIKQVQQDWPEYWQEVLTANNTRPPQHLRINLNKTSREHYLQQLDKLEIRAEIIEDVDTAVHILKAVDVKKLPGFDDGLCTVQDAGAQLAARILQPQAGERILDGCAAPGGKTSHLYQHCEEIDELVALDITPERCQLLQNTLQRTQTKATVICADICAKEHWWDSSLFDRILLDVPCSASGVIRRHPDIKLLRTEEQLAALYEKQQTILQSAWSVLKPGGTLLYSTCSIFKCENDAIIADFLQTQTDIKMGEISLNIGLATEYGRQLLPGVNNTDGFYYCLLHKN